MFGFIDHPGVWGSYPERGPLGLNLDPVPGWMTVSASAGATIVADTTDTPGWAHERASCKISLVNNGDLVVLQTVETIALPEGMRMPGGSWGTFLAECITKQAVAHSGTTALYVFWVDRDGAGIGAPTLVDGPTDCPTSWQYVVRHRLLAPTDPNTVGFSLRLYAQCVTGPATLWFDRPKFGTFAKGTWRPTWFW